jgi:hypothetical protein
MRILCGLVAILLAAAAPAHAKGTYDRVPVSTTGVKLELGAVRTLTILRAAVAKRDRQAVYRLLAPKFEILRDFGGNADAKLSARKQLDAVLNGWDGLTSLVAARNWGPFPEEKGLICGPAPLTQRDEDRVIRAAKQRGDAEDDYWFEWLYVEGTNVPVRESPSFKARAIAMISREAVRTLKFEENWYRVALPNGREGFLFERSAVPIFAPRLCIRKIKGQWRLAAFVGGGD